MSGSARMNPATVRWSLAALCAFVVVSRLAFLTTSSHAPVSADYLVQVDTVLRFGQLRLESLVGGHPLYILLCAAVAGLWNALGLTPDLVRASALTSILAVASSVIPVYWLASGLLRSRPAGLLAAGFHAIIPLTWWFSGEAINDAMGAAFLVWAFGGLYRWADGGAPRHLGLASLVMGAAPLVTSQALLFLPLFLLGVGVGAWRGRGRRPAALMLAMLPVPLLATVALQAWLAPDPGSLAALTRLRPSDLFPEGFAPRAHWSDVLFLTRMALGDVGFFAALAGLVALLVWRPIAFLWVALWAAPLLVLQAHLVRILIRCYLPVMPAAAVALAVLAALLCRPRRTRPAVVFLAAALAVVLVQYARRDLETLHNRYNVLDMIPRWYRLHTEPDSLIVAGKAYRHVRAFGAGRETLEFLDRFGREPGWESRAKTPPELLHRIDTALTGGRSAYVSDWINPVVLRALSIHYRMEAAGVMDGARLRNLRDHDFGWMGDGLRITRPIHFFRLTWRETWPRGAPPPAVDVVPPIEDAPASVHVFVTCPEEPGARCRIWVSGTREALDWSDSRFGRDPLLERCAEAGRDLELLLDAQGRGHLALPESLVEAVLEHETVFVGYEVVDPEGAARRVSAACERESAGPRP